MTDTVAPRPADRLEGLGEISTRRKPPTLEKLTPQHLKLVQYMVHGCPHEAIRHIARKERRTVDGHAMTVERPLEPGEPLSLIEAADVLRIRRRNARELFGYAAFQAELAKETQGLRNGAKPTAMATLIGLVSDPGQGKAADRKVQLQASQAILGEAAGTRQANVNVNVGVAVTPGYVIDLSEPAPTALNFAD